MSKQFMILPDSDEARVMQKAARAASGSSTPRVHKHDTSSRKVDSNAEKPVIAFVWVREGDSLIEKKIRTGLNDDTHVQVFSGLDPDDEVVTGVEVQVKGTAAGGGAVRSPFMPARRGGGGGGGRGAGGAGGAGGGGGARPAGGGGGGGR